MDNTLSIGTELCLRTYRIEQVLDIGDFDITYSAFDTFSNELVTVKEFYPRYYSPAYRDENTGEIIIPSSNEKRSFGGLDYERFAKAYQKGLEQFIEEGHILTKLSHPNVLQVHAVFKERNTGYLVTELIKEKTLRKHLNSQPEKKLSVREVEKLMGQLVASLAALHKVNLYHLDLRPENIFLKSTGKLILAEFGGVKQRFDRSWEPGVTRVSYVNPYIPFEFTIWGQHIGSESDIFGLGVILYEMLTGNVPEPSLSRVARGGDWNPKDLEEPWFSLVTSALEINSEKRPKSVKEWWLMKDSI
ncbi:MAG: protein kinase [Cyanobacteria bacterium P01_A01_bin.84]